MRPWFQVQDVQSILSQIRCFKGFHGMPLNSDFFSGDPRLEACLINDPAHITPGAQGPHVRKIQEAVVILCRMAIPLKEMENMVYGPGTTNAILSYKQQNGIINSNYETTADNIVGKMTIQSLDDGMAEFEAQLASEPKPIGGPDPRSPDPDRRPRAAPPPLRTAPMLQALRVSVSNVADAWGMPVAGWPADLKATLERSNALRTNANDYLAPIIPWGEGRKTLAELTRLFAASPETGKILEIHRRMKPFNIWPNIDTIHNVYQGTGAYGFYADPVDYDGFLSAMKSLTKYRNVIESQMWKARFCQDIGNVHGPRDTFREVVMFGAGLHVCITQPAARGKERCDIHIDTFQQGNLVASGHCVPLPDQATAAHVISVSPYLLDLADKKVQGTKEEAKQYLRKQWAKVPGL
jgi:hypothetical protein